MKKLISLALLLTLVTTGGALADVELRETYDEDGILTMDAYYDGDTMVVGENGYAQRILEYDPARRVSVVWYRDPQGEPMIRASIGAYGVAFDYDEAGRVSRNTLLDAEGRMMAGANGWAVAAYTWADGKHRTSERYFDAYGNPFVIKSGYSGVDRVFDEAMRATKLTYYDAAGQVGPNSSGVIVEKRAYDADGRIVLVTYEDAEAQPMAPEGVGAYAEASAYDDQGNEIRHEYLDAQGAPMDSAKGWATAEYAWADDTHKSSERYYTADGRPFVLKKGGYSGVDRVYNASMQAVREVFYDASGEIGPNESGVVIRESAYDGQDRVSQVMYFDAGGEPMVLESVGAYGEAFEYDEEGNVTRYTTLDAEGQPTPGPSGWTTAEYTWADKKNKLTERYYDAQGEPFVLEKGGYSGVDRAFDADMRVVRYTYYDATGEIGPNRDGVIVQTREYDAEGRLARAMYFDADGAPCEKPGIEAFGEAFTYDEGGRVATETRLDADGNPMTGANGWASAAYVWIDNKNKSSERYYGPDGQPCLLTKQGYSGLDREFDEAMRVIRLTYYDAEGQVGPNAEGVVVQTRTYDENGRLALTTYLDAALKPMLFEGIGAYGESFFYDEEGRVARDTRLSANGEAMTGANGWAVAAYTWADNRNRSSERYYDEKGKPAVLTKEGYAGIDRTFDEAMRISRLTYYDASGQIGPNADGVIIQTREYDEDGRLALIWYYGADGQPMLYENIGAFGETRAYDADGNVTRNAFLNADGQPMNAKNGWATAEYAWADKKNKTSERYFDADGQPYVLAKGGYSGIDREFDADMRVTRVTYYDASGRIGPNADGVVIQTRAYDDNGYLSLVWYYGADGQLMYYDGIGAYGEAYERDADGNVTTDTLLDSDGRMMAGNNGWAQAQYAYADAKHRTSERYYDAAGHPFVLEKGGYSGIDRTFDENLNLLTETYYDAAGRVGPNASGVIATSRELDENGRPARVWYLDAQGNRMLYEGIGAYGEAFTYDEEGRVISDSMLDADGGLMAGKNGWARAEYVWADAKNRSSERYYNADGTPHLLARGKYSGVDRAFDGNMAMTLVTYYGEDGRVGPNGDGVIQIAYERDEEGRVRRQFYLDAEGERMLYDRIGAYGKEFSYGSDGNIFREAFIDADGALMTANDGWAVGEYTWLDSKHKLTERYTDPSGAPAVIKAGYSGIDRIYDENFNVLQVTHYDAAGRVGANQNGVVTQRNEYDGQGRVTLSQYYDAQGEPMILPSIGAYARSVLYDENGLVSRETLMDASGYLMNGAAGWAYADYTWADGKHKLTERYYDAFTRPAAQNGKYAGIDRVYDERFNVLSAVYYDVSGGVGPNSDGDVIVQSAYNEDNRVVRREYLDAENRPMLKAAIGACGQTWEYDENGYVAGTTMLGADGSPTIGKNGWATATYVRDEAGRSVSDRYYDENGQLILLKDGYAGVDRAYDEAGNVTRTVYYGADGKVAPASGGFASVVNAYEGKTAVYTAYFDANGDPMAVPSVGCAAVTRELDANGRVVSERYFDTEGRTCVNAKKGFAAVNYERDEAGRAIRESYYDADGRPMAVNGVQSVVRRYDGKDNVVFTQSFDAAGAAVINRSGYSALYREFDANKRVLLERYYGPDGEPVNCSDGYGMVLCDYSEDGREVTRNYYDCDGNATAFKGYHRSLTVANERGKTGYAAYYDAEGRAVLCDDGYAAVSYAYDAQDHVTETAYYGTDNQPIMIQAGYATLIRTYEPNGKVSSESYFDVEGRAVALGNGYASIVYTYTPGGQTASTAFLDANGQPVVSKRDKYATVVYDYDAAGHKIRESYYGADMSLINKNGVATTTWVYDDEGGIAELRYYNKKGELSVNSSGYAGYTREPGVEENTVLQTYRGADWQPKGYSARMPYASVLYTNDPETGLKLREEYFNAYGKPTYDQNGIYAIIYEYDDQGRLIRQATLGAEGQLYSGRSDHSVTEYFYDEAGKRRAKNYGSSQYNWDDGYTGYHNEEDDDHDNQ